MQAFTKWVPRPGPMTRAVFEAAVGVSLARMKVETLDVLLFRWWEYGDKRYLDALKHLADLRDEGRIKYLALTNFDTERLGIIAENGVKIISNQFSTLSWIGVRRSGWRLTATSMESSC
jgi:aryl-alcohol dehydrogenase-like predicted oxidoreductase